MPLGDALYTIQETPESIISDTIETHIETILVVGGTPISVDSSFHNSVSACSSVTNLSDNFPAEFGNDEKLLIPGGDFEMVPNMVDEWSKESLVYWKSRLELMEEQKKNIKQWMADTTLKISMSIRKMKDVAEQLHADLSRDAVPILQCESMEADSMKIEEENDTASYSDPTSIKPEDEPPIAEDPGEELPVENGDEARDEEKEEFLPYPAKFVPDQEDKLMCGHGYLDFKEFASNPIAAEQAMINTVKPDVLRIMELIGDSDWEKIKKLYIVLKRVGRVDRLLVYELSEEILKTGIVDQDKIEPFLSSIDLEPAEALFQFGRALLVLYHASLLLGGEDVSVDDQNLDLFPELRKKRRDFAPEVIGDSKKVGSSKLCRQTSKNTTAERILKKQGEKLSEMFYTNPGYKQIPHQTNPAYAHVKSRYMEGLKKRLNPRCTRSRTNKMTVESASNIVKKPACQRPKVKMLTGYEKSKMVVSNLTNINKEEWAEEDPIKNKLLTAETVIEPRNATSSKEERVESVSEEPDLLLPSSSLPSMQGDRHSASKTVEKEPATDASNSTAGLHSTTVNIPSIIAPTNSMESMSVASASIGDQSTFTSGKQHATDVFSYEVFSTNLSSGDFNKHPITMIDETKVLKSQTVSARVTALKRKPYWELVNKSSSEPSKTSYRTDATLSNTSETTLTTVASNRGMTNQTLSDSSTRLPDEKSFVVVLKNAKYVGVKVRPKSPQKRDSSPTKYYPAEDQQKEGLMRTIYNNLPSLRPLIVDTLLTNIVLAYLLALTGDALSSDTKTIPKSFMCTVSHALKEKLRSVLIRALRLVDDF
ncbi:hypothetical protein GE061_006349 [Apolygus lucorum]|uniref:Uncharacterized protein n=1 Tax=Apolygus lucorum TaxID=248454 RepID=A0A8S9WV20_APOLU|nr:hypothetical protein GE061_006349 [Apolygus lucorum]